MEKWIRCKTLRPNYGPNSRELVLKVYTNTETLLHGIASAMNTEGKKTTATGIYDLLRLLQIKRCRRLGPRAVLALDCCPVITLNVYMELF